MLSCVYREFYIIKQARIQGGAKGTLVSPHPRILKEGNKKGRKREKDERKGGKAKFLSPFHFHI